MPGLELIGPALESIGETIGLSESASALSGGYVTQTQPQSLKNLTQKKVKVKPEPDDAKRVIKGSDVVTCVETALNGATLALDTFKSMGRAIIGGSSDEAWGQEVANQIIACVRKKYLRQTKPEVKKDGPHRTRKG